MNVGDRVFVVCNNVIVECTLSGIQLSGEELIYTVDVCGTEMQLQPFATPEALTNWLVNNIKVC